MEQAIFEEVQSKVGNYKNGLREYRAYIRKKTLFADKLFDLSWWGQVIAGVAVFLIGIDFMGEGLKKMADFELSDQEKNRIRYSLKSGDEAKLFNTIEDILNGDYSSIDFTVLPGI